LVFLGSEFVWFFVGSDSVGLSLDLDILFFRIGLFRLLIQRCKNVTGWGSLFDQGEVWPDESEMCPTNGFLGDGPPAATRKIKPPRDNRGGNFFSGDLFGFSGSGFE